MPSVHEGADIGDTVPGPGGFAQAKTDTAYGRGAEPDEPAVRLQVSDALRRGERCLRGGGAGNEGDFAGAYMRVSLVSMNNTLRYSMNSEACYSSRKGFYEKTDSFLRPLGSKLSVLCSAEINSACALSLRRRYLPVTTVLCSAEMSAVSLRETR